MAGSVERDFCWFVLQLQSLLHVTRIRYQGVPSPVGERAVWGRKSFLGLQGHPPDVAERGPGGWESGRTAAPGLAFTTVLWLAV